LVQASPPQLIPQPPQFAGSLRMLRHDDAQHCWLAPQTIPQPPQFASSSDSERQLLLQHVWPAHE